MSENTGIITYYKVLIKGPTSKNPRPYLASARYEVVPDEESPFVHLQLVGESTRYWTSKDIKDLPGHVFHDFYVTGLERTPEEAWDVFMKYHENRAKALAIQTEWHTKVLQRARKSLRRNEGTAAEMRKV